MSTAPITFEPPGPGSWELESTHRGRRPFTPFVQGTLVPAVTGGMKALLARYGLPLEDFKAGLVHGVLYLRPVGVGEGEVPKPPPPRIVMKLGARLLPEMRRRNRTAAQAWREKRWRTDVDRWFDHDRAALVARNLTLGEVDLPSLDDDHLLEHIDELLAHFGTQAGLNMETHGGDIVPIGDLLAHCRRWGISDAEATSLLRGSSPATTETAQLLAPAARAIAAAGAPPTSVEEVRRLGSDTADAVDSWLAHHGWRLITSDDIDKPTLAERPDLQLASLLAAADVSAGGTQPVDPADLRRRVPDDQRALFDELVVEARYGMRQRDDNVGVRWNWSGGLLRRALLEAGRRLVAAERLVRADHVVELEPAELGPLLRTGDGPGRAEVASRASRRDQVEAARAPDRLGPPEDPPPVDALPKPMARATEAMLAMLDAEGTAGTPGDEELSGVGIGTASYRGTARVVQGADDALDRLQPGDVLVAPFTGPSYNSVVPLLGALVVEEGGPMSHAGIVAREFGKPAVLGATGATRLIPDGALVEVDPVAGRVLVIDETG